MTKHRRTRKRNQKGGAWYNPLSWGKQDPNAPRRSWGQWFSSSSNNLIQGADNAVGSAANTISTGAQNAYSSVFSSNTQGPPPVVASTVDTSRPPNAIPDQGSSLPLSNISDQSVTQPLSSGSQPTSSVSSNNSTIGGKRRKSRKMKGGYTKVGGPESLVYYAVPVQGLKVASPTYWVTSKTNPPLSGGSKRHLKKRKTIRRKSRIHKK